MKYALIGLGRVAPHHIEAARRNNLSIEAVCDINLEKAQAFVRNQKLPESVRIYTDYLELIEKEQPQLLAIATYSGEHAKIALAALEKGINVIVEKPMALSLEDADRMILAARKSGAVLAVNHQNRFNPVIQKIRRALDEGKLGRVLYGAATVRWYRGQEYYNMDRGWRGTWDEDGGCLMNQCIHNADLLLWMLGGEAEEVFAYTANLDHPYIETEDLGLSVWHLKNGTYGIFEGTTLTRPSDLEETLTIFGTRGTVQAGGKSLNHMILWNIEKADESGACGAGAETEAEAEEETLESIKKACDENPSNVYGFGHTPLYQDVISAIEEHRQPLVDGEAGRRALEIILSMYESRKKGLPVKLPLEKAASSDFKGMLK